MTNQAAQTMPSLIDRVRECHAAWAAYNAVAPGEDRAVGTEKLLSEVLSALAQTAGVADASKWDDFPDGDISFLQVPDSDARYEVWFSVSENHSGVWRSYFNPDTEREPGDELHLGDFPSKELAQKYCEAHMLAAAPAASGAHPDALQDGTLSKSTAKRVEALAAASVSERARELLAAECENSGFLDQAEDLRAGLILGGLPGVALRAIEQALTQQRDVPPNLGDARLIPQFMAKWEWLILSRCRDEFQDDLLSLLDGKGE